MIQTKISEVWRISKEDEVRKQSDKPGMKVIAENNTRFTNNKDKANAIADVSRITTATPTSHREAFQQNRMK